MSKYLRSEHDGDVFYVGTINQTVRVGTGFRPHYTFSGNPKLVFFLNVHNQLYTSICRINLKAAGMGFSV